MIDLKNKAVVVTGAGGGIGRAICLACAKAGADIVAAGHHMKSAEDVAEEVSAMGVKAVAAEVDITDENSVEELVNTAVKTFGKIDVMINNAGICIRCKAENMSLTDWNQTMNINATGTFLCCRAVIPQMKKQGYGKIINTASQAGKIGYEGLAHYCASKAAVILLTRALAAELAPYGITVNSVCPGNVNTEMTVREARQIQEETGRPVEDIMRELHEVVPIGRMAEPEDVADVVLFLASSLSDYLTGEDVNVTGGLTMV